MQTIGNVSDLTKLNWSQVLDLTASEFLSYASYRKTEIIEENKRIKEQQRKLKRR